MIDGIRYCRLSKSYVYRVSHVAELSQSARSHSVYDKNGGAKYQGTTHVLVPNAGRHFIDTDKCEKMIKKDGSELPRGRYSLDGGNLTIENIQKEDRGMYQCSASNDAATVTADTELMIETLPPRAPYNVTANSTSNSIFVTWAEGYRRPRLVYKVWYRAVDVSEWRTMRVSNSLDTEANITNLMPSQEYEIMIMSEDANGDGMFSKAIKVYTKPSQLYTGPSEFRAPLDAFLQISAPTFVQVVPVKDGHLVTWRAPEHGAESLRRYIVRWTRSEYEFKCGSAETQDTQYLVTDLEEDELYTFQVLAMSTTDYQAASHKVEVRVPPYTRIRAVTIGVAAALLVCAVSIAVLIYARRKCIRPDDPSEEEKQPETKA
ncbi:protein borderless-like [Ctenocephalides felis]|uniref:protein borderless-like n=1 Tax=Ctenocephalides felis TaxID=7515 RepID=UPI000E6E10C3|nr:protein borderless-like [Ctenocephalides felis]